VIVATWNVLHRIHAINWREPVIDAHADETARITEIAAHTGTLGDVVCLQEVSGDLLAALRAAHPGATIVSHRSPRIPRVRPTAPSPLADATEHLVVLTTREVTASRGITFASDPGKGFLAVRLADGSAVISVHVSYGERHAEQCAEVAFVARSFTVPGPIVVAGDFNADRDTCVARLGEGFVAAVVADPALPTRPRTEGSEKASTIDHLLVLRGEAVDATVVSGRSLSDHNPVVARVLPR